MRPLAPIAPLAVTLVLAAGCGSSGTAASAPQRGWVEGVALGGKPTCPQPTGRDTLVCHHGPLPHAVVLVGAHRLRADAHGRFRIALAPGRYVVRAGAGPPVVATVANDRVVHVRLRTTALTG